MLVETLNDVGVIELEEFSERQKRFGLVEQLHAREYRMRAARLALNRSCVDRWNACHPSLRKERQRIYDARKNAKRKAVSR